MVFYPKKTRSKSKTVKAKKPPMMVVVRRKPTIKKGPKLDSVVTRNIKFIAKTAQTSSVHDCLLSNAKNTFVSNRILLDVQLIPGLDVISKVYQEYRIDGVTFSFIPVATTAFNDDQGGDVSQTAKSIPRFYVKVIKGNERFVDKTWANESACLIDGARSCTMNKSMKLSFCPTQTLVGARDSQITSATTVIGPNVPIPVRRMWNGFQSVASHPALYFYGLQYGIGSTNADNGEFQYKVVVNVKMSFRNPSDETGNIAAFGATIYTE
jgi:hypothetical protein